MERCRFGMKTEKGKTTIINRKNGRTVVFDLFSDALMYLGIMIELYHEKEYRRPMEPYQVRELCPGKYPIKIKI